ncbi:MAG: hypothetical protein LBS36_13305 [Oscillospiraceae bacterium]|jgi:hypothetical protein|nr:hypothetical protein [Oscillospiraceae bacterium]
MNNLIDRYVYDVIRRLPEHERADVEKELRANIFDMLPEDADEQDIAAVLSELGSPFYLANQYRQPQRYLISPAVYNDYLRVLKHLVPIVGALVFVIGVFVGIMESLDFENGLAYRISHILSQGFSLGFSAAFYMLFWTTVGFVIAERTGAYNGLQKHREWKISDLPEQMPGSGKRIPLSDSIAELIVTLVFCGTIILYCFNAFPFLLIRNGALENFHIFNAAALNFGKLAFSVIAVLGSVEALMKIIFRRWTLPVLLATLANSLVSMGFLLHIFNRPDLLLPEFVTYVKTAEWGNADIERFFVQDGLQVILLLVCVLVVLVSLLEIGLAVYKTVFQYRRKKT